MGRGAILGAAGLLAATLALPLWSTRMVAPQYQGDEALRVSVYAGRVTGDIHEIELLNQYVGVHLPLDTPELAAAPWVLGGLALLAFGVGALPARRRRTVAAALCVLMVLVLVGGAALLQYRLHRMGHERSPTIMTGVPDFTPPVVGSRKIANFTAHMRLDLGAWAYLAALLLVGWSLGRRRGARAVEGAARSLGSGGGPAAPSSRPLRRVAVGGRP